MKKSELKEKFIHLHVHNSFSFKDGVGTPQSRIDHALRNNLPAVATSNHGNIADWISIYNGCKKNGLKPVLGCEIYFNRHAEEFREALSTEGKESVQKRKELRKFNRHFTVFAKNLTGYYNIIKIHNDAWINGFYHVPISSPKVIEENGEGVIATTGCASSEINRLLAKKKLVLSDDREGDIQATIDAKVKLLKTIFRTKNITKYYENEYLSDFEIDYFNTYSEEKFDESDYREKAYTHLIELDKEFIKTIDQQVDELVDWWTDIFEDYYVELMTIDFADQEYVNKELIQLAKRRNLPVIITNDSHYVSKLDAGVQEMMMLSDQKKTFDDIGKEGVWTIKTKELYYKTVDELYESWEKWHKSDIFTEDVFWEGIENAVKLVDSIEEFDIDKSSKLPKLYGDKSEKMLIKKIHEGMKTKGLVGNKEYEERIKFELKVVKKKGFIDYFLIMDDIIGWAKENYGKYSVGPGRGCFVPNSKVKMSDGSYKEIQNIQKGDRVVSGWGSLRDVKQKFEYDVNEKMSRIKVGNDIIECTQDHKILVIPKGKRKDLNSAIWKEASKIEKGDLLVKNI